MTKTPKRIASNRRYDVERRKVEYRAWYNTDRWRTLRKHQLIKQPLCERCLSRKHTKRANVAHHRIPHKGDPILFWDANNLGSLCSDCHDIDEQRIERGGKARRDVDADGWPTP